jgi:hypothetical protein
VSLRFAIIKHVKIAMGDDWEDVTFEYLEDSIYDDLLEFLAMYLPPQKWYKRQYSSKEIAQAFEKAWVRTISDFKKVTVKLF